MQFPKYVFKGGTGKHHGHGRYTAEHALVRSPEELEALGPGWHGSPADAVSMPEGALGLVPAQAQFKTAKKVK